MTTNFQQVALTDITPSTTNPRKHFDEQKLAELIDSVKVNGIVQPILLRPKYGGYELVAGERRYRAAKAAGLETIPAVIRELTDEAVAELQMIENGQREDIHPLEEAAGYHNLLLFGKRNAGWIAGRIGKSEKYVYDRMKLLDLTPQAQGLFLGGEIDAGHAIQLARLTPAQQKQTIEDHHGLFDAAYLAFTPEEEDQLTAKDQTTLTRKARTVRELQTYINKHFRFDPSKADPFLFPETTDTVKRAAEKKEKVVSITHELHIQDEARDPRERTVVPSSWERADGQHDSKTCPHSIIGVVVCGPGRGDSFRVCMAKEKCKIHWGQWQKERAKRPQTGGPAAGLGQAAHWKKEETRRAAEDLRKQENERRWKTGLPEILDALATAVKKAPTKASGLLAKIVIDEVTRDGGNRKAAAYVPLGTTAEDALRHAAFIAIYQNGQTYFEHALAQLTKIGRAFHVDVKKIMDQVSPLPKQETEKKNGKKTKAA